MDNKEVQELQKVLGAVFGEPLQDTADIGGIPVVLRTLWDVEVSDSLRRSLQHTSIEYQLFDIKRWKLAYALISANEIAFPEAVEEKYKLISGSVKDDIKGWPNYFVERIFGFFQELCDKEDELANTLKKSTGTDEKIPNT